MNDDHADEPAPEEGEHLELTVDPDLASGAYANFATVWHTAHEFTLDFFAPAQPGAAAFTHTARVRVPPSVIFSVARAIADNVNQYEDSFGAIDAPDSDGDVYPPPWDDEEGGPG